MLVCPKCGKKSDEIDFVEAFCINCYPVNIIPPKKIHIKACKHCSKMFLKGEWVPYSKKKIGEYVSSKCRGDFSETEYNYDKQEMRFTIRKRDSQMYVEKRIPLDIETVTCKRCSRISGGYFEAIVQLRGEELSVEKYRKIFIKRLSKKTFIAKEKPQKTGIDLFIGKTRAVLELMHDLGLRAKITRKLIGRSEGKRLYRTTFAIRLGEKKKPSKEPSELDGN